LWQRRCGHLCVLRRLRGRRRRSGGRLGLHEARARAAHLVGRAGAHEADGHDLALARRLLPWLARRLSGTAAACWRRGGVRQIGTHRLETRRVRLGGALCGRERRSELGAQLLRRLVRIRRRRRQRQVLCVGKRR
jgi:hypothetical protein